MADTIRRTCPRCGHHNTTIRVDHQNGTYFCTCAQLFYGGDTEWRRFQETRRLFQQRMTGTPSTPGTKEAS